MFHYELHKMPLYISVGSELEFIWHTRLYIISLNLIKKILLPFQKFKPHFCLSRKPTIYLRSDLLS